MFKTIVDKELTVAAMELNVATADSSLFHAVSPPLFPFLWPWPSGDDFASASEEDEEMVETDRQVDPDRDDHSDADTSGTATESTVNGQSRKAVVSDLGPALSNR